MTKNMRYGPRFNGGSTQLVRATGYISIPSRQERRAPSSGSKPAQQQKMSVKFRERKGIKPSLPRFSFDDPLPEPPPAPPKPNPLKVAQAVYARHRCTALEVITQNDNQALVAMRDGDKAFNVCINIYSGKVKWTEGPAPYVARNGSSKRKEQRT